MEINNNYAFLEGALAPHRIPQTGVRDALYQAARNAKSHWTRRLLMNHNDGDGKVQLSLGLNRYTSMDDEWGTSQARSIGEIGFVRTAQGDEQLVWRTAFSYGLDGQPDVQQPWRAADSPSQAVALLAEAFGQQIWPDEAGRFYAAVTQQSLGCDRQRPVEQGLRYCDRVITRCLTHRNSVRRPLNDTRWSDYPSQKRLDDRTSYYDPATGSITPARMLRHTRRWHGTAHVLRTGETGSTAYDYYNHISWDVSRVRHRSYITLYDAEAHEWAMVCGKRVPQYVRDMIRITQGCLYWFPNPYRGDGGVRWHSAINDYIQKNTRDQIWTCVAAPDPFRSSDNYIMSY